MKKSEITTAKQEKHIGLIVIYRIWICLIVLLFHISPTFDLP